jgi:tetratricopeptide (TPR) repeat protein
MKSTLLKVVASLILIFISVFQFEYFKFISTYTEVMNGNRDEKVVDELFSGLAYELPKWEALLKLYNEGYRDCVKLDEYTDKLLEANSRNGAAFYIKAVCKEKIEDLKTAESLIEKALQFDRFNPDYLFGLAIIKYRMNKFDESRIVVENYNKISKDVQRLKPLLEKLNEVKN